MDLSYSYKTTCPSCLAQNVAIYGAAELVDASAFQPRPRSIMFREPVYTSNPHVLSRSRRPAGGLRADSSSFRLTTYPKPTPLQKEFGKEGWKCVPSWYAEGYQERDQSTPCTSTFPSGWLPNTQDACQSLGDSVWTDQWSRTRMLAIEAVLFAVVAGQGLHRHGWSLPCINERRDVALAISLAKLVSLPARMVSWNIGYKPGPHVAISQFQSVPRPIPVTPSAVGGSQRVGCYWLSTEFTDQVEELQRKALDGRMLASFTIRLVGALCGCSQLHDWYEDSLKQSILSPEVGEESGEEDVVHALSKREPPPFGYLRETVLISRLTLTQVASWVAVASPSPFVPASKYEAPLFCGVSSVLNAVSKMASPHTPDGAARAALPLNPQTKVESELSWNTEWIFNAMEVEDPKRASFLTPVEWIEGKDQEGSNETSIPAKFEAFHPRRFTTADFWADMGRSMELYPNSVTVLTTETSRCSIEEMLRNFPKPGQPRDPTDIPTEWRCSERNEPLGFTAIYSDVLVQLCFARKEIRSKREFEVVRAVRTFGADAAAMTKFPPPTPEEDLSQAERIELSIVRIWNEALNSVSGLNQLSLTDRNLLARTYFFLSSLSSPKLQQTSEWRQFVQLLNREGFDVEFYRKVEFGATSCAAEFRW